MHEKKRQPEVVTIRGQTVNDDHIIQRERRSDRLLPWLVILTLVLGIAAMSVDYVWRVLLRDSAEVPQVEALASELEP